MIMTMKKILLILLLIMPSVVMLADGPQYKFLRNANGNAAVSRQTSGRNSDRWAKPADINVNINANARTVNYDDVFRVQVASRSLVSNEVSINTEGDNYSVSETGASNGIILGRKSESTTAAHGSAITAVFSKNAREVVTLGHNGKLALAGAELGPDAGTAQPPSTAHTPVGDAMVPMLLMALAFAAFKFKKH